MALAGLGVLLEHTVWATNECLAQCVFAGPLIIGAAMISRAIRRPPRLPRMAATIDTSSTID